MIGVCTCNTHNAVYKVIFDPIFFSLIYTRKLFRQVLISPTDAGSKYTKKIKRKKKERRKKANNKKENPKTRSNISLYAQICDE